MISKVGYGIRPSVALGVPETYLDMIDPQTIVTSVVSSRNLFEIGRSRLGNDSFLIKKNSCWLCASHTQEPRRWNKTNRSEIVGSVVENTRFYYPIYEIAFSERFCGSTKFPKYSKKLVG